MEDTQEKKAIVKAQNFDEIVTSLADFTERASKEHTSLDKLEPHRKFLVKSKTPTIEDINKVVAGIDGELIDLKKFNLEVLNVLTGVVVALSALDKEHISGILITANLAKEASEQAVNNVKSISAIITILKSQEHLRDIDQTWKDLEKQKEITKGLSNFKVELAKLQHLMDVDKLWKDVSTQGRSIEVFSKRITEVSKVLEEQGKTIASFGDTIKGLVERQQAYFDATNKHLNDRQEAIDRHLDEREKALQESFATLDKELKKSQESLQQKTDDLSKTQADTLTSMQRAQAEKLSQLGAEQTRQLDAIQKSQEEALVRIADAQAIALNNIAKESADRLELISKAQTETLARIEKEQVDKLEEINKSLEEEKTALKDSVASLTQKVKVAYAIAGGAATITIIHLLLNVLGVL